MYYPYVIEVEGEREGYMTEAEMNEQIQSCDEGGLDVRVLDAQQVQLPIVYTVYEPIPF